MITHERNRVKTDEGLNPLRDTRAKNRKYAVAPSKLDEHDVSVTEMLGGSASRDGINDRCYWDSMH
jgi:hypothetical protein